MFAKKIFAISLLIFIMLSFFTIAGLRVEDARFASTLPDISNLSVPLASGPTTITDSRNDVIASFTNHHTDPLPLDQIPLLLQHAFIDAEDSHFYSHQGIDYKGLIRAGINDFIHHKSQGGSTITQQLIKNMVTGNEHSILRKITEAMLARRLESQMSKNRILEIYLNTIWLGAGAYGVPAASTAWFNKPMSQLNIAEIAFLAGLPKGPAVYDPIKHPQLALARRHYVLNRMCINDDIDCNTISQWDKYTLPTPIVQNTTGYAPDWYSETVRRQIVHDYGSSILYAGGMHIHSYQDTHLQTIAQSALINGIETYETRHPFHGILHGVPDNAPPSWQVAEIIDCKKNSCNVLISGTNTMVSYPWHEKLSKGDMVFVNHNSIVELPDTNGAVIIMDADNGHVLADIGGLQYQGGFNRAIQSKRQTGSIVKPIIAMLALSNGYKSDSVILDVPITLMDNGIEWSPGADGGDGMGAITLDTALAQSRNQGFVRIANDIGFDKVYEAFKLSGLYPDSTKLPQASVLGAVETSPLNVAVAYSSIVNNGYLVTPQYISSATDKTGHELYISPQLPTHIRLNGTDIPDMSPLKNMMHDVVTKGTATAPFKGMDTTDIGGKTGTSNDVVDSWFAGYKKNIVIVVHIGYDTPKSLGDKEFGATIAAPIAAEIMRQI